MVVMAVMATLCTAGVAFYVRFLVALCAEWKHRWIGYLVRIEPDAGDYAVVDTQDFEESFRQAA